MCQKVRVETLTIKVVEPEGFAELIQKHAKGELVHGCFISCIASGDKVKELDELEEKHFNLKEKMKKLEKDIKSHFKGLF